MKDHKLLIATAALVVAYLLATRTCRGRAIVARLRGKVLEDCGCGCTGAHPNEEHEHELAAVPSDKPSSFTTYEAAAPSADKPSSAVDVAQCVAGCPGSASARVGGVGASAGAVFLSGAPVAPLPTSDALKPTTIESPPPGRPQPVPRYAAVAPTVTATKALDPKVAPSFLRPAPLVRVATPSLFGVRR